jgi:hypothetical protein
MRPVTDKFLETLRGSHRMVADARICTTFQTGTDPTGTEIPILEGDVAADATADIRSTIDLTTEGVGLWSADPDGLLTPYGNELFVRRGIEYADGQKEIVSLGYYRITDVEQDEAPDGPIRLAGSDRMRGIADAEITTPIQFHKGHTFDAVFGRLVDEVYPDGLIEFDFDATTTTIGREVVAEGSRYTFLRDLVAARGKVMYFDHRGILVVHDWPDPGQPVWDVNSGEGGVLITQARNLSREGMFNAVVATGEGADTDTPPRAVVVDNDPRSPTYWRGRFGKVPRFYSSPFITNADQARSAGETMLRARIGLPYAIDYTAIVNPALEVLDTVRVINPRDSALHVNESLTIPLTADAPMTGTTRDQTRLQLALEGEDGE